MTDIDALIEVSERNRTRDEAVFDRLVARCGIGSSEPVSVSVSAIAKEVGLKYDKARVSVRRLAADGYVELVARGDEDAHGNAIRIVRDLNDLPNLDDFEL